MPRRVVNLGNARSPKFRYVSARSRGSIQAKGRTWASCEKNITTVKFRREIPVREGSGFYVSGRTVEIIIATFAVFAFAPLSVPGLTLGYAGAGTGAPFAVLSTGLSGNIGLFFTGVMTSLGFASPSVKTPVFANLNKPCSEDANIGKY